MFWVWNAGVTALLAVAWWLAVLPLTEPGLSRFMAAGLTLVIACYLYGPTCLDLTGWTVTVMAMLPFGVILLVGSPLIYALWVTFVGDHVEVSFK